MLKIEVVYTTNGESADMYVERQTEELKDAGCPNVMVSLFPQQPNHTVQEVGHLSSTTVGKNEHLGIRAEIKKRRNTKRRRAV